MHISDVAGVDATLHGLQIVALLQPLRDEDMAYWQIAPFDAGWRRFLFLQPHKRPDDAGAFDAGITFDPHRGAGLRRGRHVHAVAEAVEFEAVIGAADSVLLVSAEVERSAAMRAEFADQSGFAIGGAKSKKLLAENLHAHLRPIPFGYFTRQQDRHPVTPQQITHASTRTGSYQRF